MRKAFEFLVDGAVSDICISEKLRAGIASENGCAYILEPNGKVLKKICGSKEMVGASYSNGKFGFINADGHVYITDENGKLVNDIEVGKDYSQSIVLAPNGFLACKFKCGFFDFSGNRLWDVATGGICGKPAHFKGYWYVPVWYRHELLIMKDGKIVNSMRYKGRTYGASVCGSRLAVASEEKVYLYRLDNPAEPEESWRIGGFRFVWRVAFGPYCRFLTAGDRAGEGMPIYRVGGNLIWRIDFGGHGEPDYRYAVWAVAWRGKRLAVGLGGGSVYAYDISIAQVVFPLSGEDIIS